ncbi:hypothetical protein RUMLAC_01611 [[Ruminococcus] lactaris ATCC 29176]|uniref:Uncharacterized protein n=1 Tax=[Ruminococcus] lactaris ATCC 29176 TaxID=471875 RepID=B5CQ66_9FIRM|nr:hypothetical protein RUMLAC_01611 [[Ruminococcus] lactaris ATCC 29176]
MAYITGITSGFAVSRVAASGIADTSLFLYFMQWMSVCFRKKSPAAAELHQPGRTFSAL